jgi:hypothetical protein
MAQNIIIICTNVFSPKDRVRILCLNESFPCITELSIDLTDCNKVLRVASGSNISRLLTDYLEIEDIKCKLMGVYQKIEERVIVIFERKHLGLLGIYS